MQDLPLRPVEAMEELTRRGAAALPELVEHLGDARNTKAVIHGIAGIHYSAEFDRNYRTNAKHAVGVTPKRGNDPVKLVGDPERNEYVVLVGDLCFNIIGSIVNRDFHLVRYQPSAIVVVNSPILCPDLREAVRGEWQGCTAQSLQASLKADVITPDTPTRGAEAIQALWRFYPQATASILHERLSMPTNSFGDTVSVVNALNQVHSAAIEDEIWRTFERHNGDHSTSWTSRDEVAAVCARHLAGGEHTPKLLEFCRRRVNELDVNQREVPTALIELLSR
jgi:hypothetical protein